MSRRLYTIEYGMGSTRIVECGVAISERNTSNTESTVLEHRADFNLQLAALRLGLDYSIYKQKIILESTNEPNDGKHTTKQLVHGVRTIDCN